MEKVREKALDGKYKTTDKRIAQHKHLNAELGREDLAMFSKRVAA